ncbi:MAG: TIGR03620 family F420-dependent LLM class oxidoreductase [Candidatus Binataceae bacterium]
MDPGRIGAFAYVDTIGRAELPAFARTLERLGYSIFWIPETFGRDPFVLAAHLLSATERLVIASGIANVWKRDAIATAGAARTLAELFDERFILGLGVSGGPFMRRNGLRYERPLTYMREYLARMKTAPFKAPPPAHEPPLMIAALLPKMLELARRDTHGTIAAMVPPERLVAMRAALGPGKWLCAQQIVMLETDAKKARCAARRFLNFYLNAPPYQRNLRAMGFGDDDLSGGGSDRLIDTLIAWGDERRIRERTAAFFQAGADHVYLSALSSSGGLYPEMRALEALAPN